MRWRCIDLKQLIRTRFGVDYHERSVGKLLAALGFSHISGRARATSARMRGHRRNLKKSFPEHLAKIVAAQPPDTPIEVWFQDEMIASAEEQPGRQWAPKGSRPPPIVKDRRTSSAYLFGPSCPERGEGAALVMPRANTEAMDLHLEEISRAVAPNAHAVVLLDQAAWHTTGKLGIPENISLVPLATRPGARSSPKMSRQYLRQNWLSNQCLRTYEAIVEAILPSLEQR